MSKQSKSSLKPKPASETRESKADRMIRKLRSNYELGEEAISKTDNERVSTVAFAEAQDLSEHTLRKFKLFAKTYDSEELDELCALRRPNGLPLHWGYVCYLLAAHKHGGKEARQRYEKLAATKGWTAPQLNAAVRREFQRQPGHGRKMELASDLETAIVEVCDQGRAWCKRCDLLVKRIEAKNSSGNKALSKTSVPDDMFATLKEIKKVADRFVRVYTDKSSRK